ncbi:cytochrome c biogenesis heme-transporting ATPase CcmA [Pseudoduganella sp. LjRoot289]|uniref:cytochrome c biogenesis heme-transporting ATPase CcmA n=1 Tax=Pseudoduganella sp. LjRoot289 TaxID=3342314 RepID=UPI003ED12946
MTLQAWGLACARGGRSLFSGVAFELRAGEALWVKGGNGSGKTSLLRLLSGLGVPQEGEVRWKGRTIRSQREDYHGELLYCGHAAAVKDDLSAWENVAMASSLAGRACNRADAERALELAGLGHMAALPGRALSQGQRRRVALARLFLPSLPALLLLDEPFAALDAASADTLCARIAGHLGQGGMAVYTTHQAHALETGKLQVLDLEAGAGMGAPAHGGRHAAGPAPPAAAGADGGKASAVVHEGGLAWRGGADGGAARPC